MEQVTYEPTTTKMSMPPVDEWPRLNSDDFDKCLKVNKGSTVCRQSGLERADCASTSETY